MSEPELIRAESLTKRFTSRGGEVAAVNDVSLTIHPGETYGLVGESGSGKSTMARLLLRLQEPTEGRVLFRGQDLADLKGKQLREVRRQMQMVFQNPYGSLLPHYTAVANVAEPLRLHGIGHKEQRRAEAVRLLDLVGISPQVADRYPRQFSGGQQQRIAVARALALKPELLVCDEPTSSLDVSVQAQILELFDELQRTLNFACVFISHNLAVVERVASRVMVMCQGRVVEAGPTDRLFNHPGHPYTQALLGAVLPVRDEPQSRRTAHVDAPTEPSAWVLTGELEETSPGHFVRASAG